jgi:hypothetical protein
MKWPVEILEGGRSQEQEADGRSRQFKRKESGAAGTAFSISHLSFFIGHCFLGYS